MSGREYLQNIKEELLEGRYQHKKGINILSAFGYARRRKTALNTINKELKRLGIKTDPSINQNMPMDSTHIRFFLVDKSAKVRRKLSTAIDESVEDQIDEAATEPSITSFKVADLDAAARQVTCVKTNESLSKAYTIMLKKKYSQLVVADFDKPVATSIKGIVSYQSIADALISGKAKTVGECLDKTTPHVSVDDDIDRVVEYLEKHEVVLVIGEDKHLCGIVTAWDLAAEFANLVGPFKRIGEIEYRVTKCIKDKLGPTAIEALPGMSASVLTLGDLVRIIQNPDNWEKLQLPFDRQEFSGILDEVRELRNRLMHFRDPLDGNEMRRLQDYCELVRKI